MNNLPANEKSRKMNNAMSIFRTEYYRSNIHRELIARGVSSHNFQRYFTHKFT